VESGLAAMSSAANREPVLTFRILGPVEVYDNGRPIALGGGKQRALLAILLTSPNATLSTDRLIEALWGSDPPASAANSVHVYVSQLRKTLGDGLLVTRGRGYTFEVDPMQIDAQRFERLVQTGSEQLVGGDPQSAAETLREALALWRGPALAEFAYDDFAQAAIDRLQDLRLAALEDRVEADLAIGRAAALVPELETLVRENPLRERLRGQLMVALYRSGRQAQALDVYREGRRLLADELGLDPGPQLQELERRILAQDLELDPAAPSIAPPVRSRRFAATALAASAAVLLAVVAAVAVQLSRGDGAGLASVAPNSVGVIDAESNRIVAQLPVGVRPGTLVAGDGAVWVANLADESISRIDPETNALVKTISTGFAPTGLAVDDGRVWVAGSDSSLSWIDPQYNRLTRAATLDPSFFRKPPTHPVAVGFGSIWMSDPIGQVNRIDRSTGRIVSKIDVGEGANGIAVGAGSVWVANSHDGTVSRVDPTGVVTATIPVGHGPTGVAFGDGRVWVAVSLDGVVAGIDPESGAVAARLSVGERPEAVAAGLGAIWVGDSRVGRVFRIDPGSGEVTRSIDLGSSPGALAVVGGSLWATVTPLAAPPAVGAGVEEGTLHVEVEHDPGVLDPAALLLGKLQLEYATCAKLVNYPDRSAPAGSQLVPEVAESMPAVSRDGLRYTFTVRPGFVFSPPSNEPVTAQTFKATIERTLHPKMKSDGAALLADVVGAKAYMAGRAKHITGVTAQGDKLVVRLTRPAGDLPARLSVPYFCAVPSGTPVDSDGVEGIPMAGPYYVSSHVRGQQIVLVRNPNYGGDRPQGPTEIHYTIGVSRQRTQANVLAGRTDYAAEGVPISEQPELIARLGPGSPAAEAGRQQFFVNPMLGMFYFALNTQRPLFADPRVRRAVSYAVDRAALARAWNRFFEAGTFAGGPPTADYLPPGMRVSSRRVEYPIRPDAAGARSLAGGSRRVAVLFTCNTPPCPQQAAILERNLATIGIDLVVKAFPVSLLLQRAYEPNAPYDLLRIGWFTDNADPAAMLEPLLRRDGVNNLSHIDSLDRQLDAAAKLTGPARDRGYDRLARRIAEDVAPLVAFENITSGDFFSERVGCQVFNPVYGISLTALCFR
jgi:YVTN family beta-propeller protein